MAAEAGLSAYGASKAGLVSFCETLSSRSPATV
ncbi:hypothetical protein ACFQV8_14960 [Pseudonocardia benzenivorans]